MSDFSAVQKAIDDSNKAFEAFKEINESKSKSQGDKLAEMEKAFADVTKSQEEVKALKTMVETMEAKANRPGFGAGGDVDKAQAEHKEAFGGYMRKGREYNIEIEQKALAISTNSGADGGFAVPKVIDAMIQDLLVNISPIRSIASVQQISTSDFHKLVNLRGTASGWVGEIAARPATTTPTLADIKPTMGELYANPQATQQMLDDSFFNAEAWLADQVATEFARSEGAAFITGTGSSMPTGFLAGTPLATVDGVRAFGSLQYTPTGVAGAFATSNPTDLFFTVAGQLKKGQRQGAKWVMNKATLFQVAAFKDTSGRYIFTPVMSPEVPASILGWEAVEAEDMPGVGANAFAIAFGNFKNGYLIVDRIGTRVIRDPFTNKPYIGFYTTKRTGGAVIDSEAIKLVKFAVS
jgi:HK97 family phage major capsid protein